MTTETKTFTKEFDILDFKTIGVMGIPCATHEMMHRWVEQYADQKSKEAQIELLKELEEDFEYDGSTHEAFFKYWEKKLNSLTESK